MGTYSSIFVASPLLLLLKLKRGVNTGKEVTESSDSWSNNNSKNRTESKDNDDYKSSQKHVSKDTSITESLKNDYKLLGLEPSASKNAIKRTYRELANKYHPDKAPSTTNEIRELAEQKFKQIKLAYDRIIESRR